MRKVSRKTIARALVYIRTVESLIKEKRNLVSSRQLAEITGLTDVQIRKDISHFGRIGVPRLGYRTQALKEMLEDFILQRDVVHIVLFGVGNLGSAILRYPGFHREKIRLVAAFDRSARRIGKTVGGVKVYPVQRSPKIIRKTHADIGIIAVPESSCQEVADLMVLAGLKGIVNFAPAMISVPKNVLVKDIDLSIEFLSLFCNTRRL